MENSMTDERIIELAALYSLPYSTLSFSRAIEAEVTAPLLERIAALEAQTKHPTQPVLVVEREPDYWSGGHFYNGKKPHTDPFKVYGLPIGTRLYTSPPKVELTDEQIAALTAQLGEAKKGLSDVEGM